jgi:hypothetical protein
LKYTDFFPEEVRKTTANRSYDDQCLGKDLNAGWTLHTRKGEAYDVFHELKPEVGKALSYFERGAVYRPFDRSNLV